MVMKKTGLGARWATATDVLDRLTKIREIREAQRRTLSSFEDRVRQRRTELEGSLSNLTDAERQSISARATASFRADLRNSSSSQRAELLTAAIRHGRETETVAAHYQSPTQMLMRESLGSERRSRIHQQIENSGPAELASLAEFAAGTRDVELAAALCSRNSTIKATLRTFSSHELADALFGDEHRRVSDALNEIQRLAQEVANEDRAFVSGRRNPTATLEIALMKRGPSNHDDGDESRSGGGLSSGPRAS